MINMFDGLAFGQKDFSALLRPRDRLDAKPDACVTLPENRYRKTRVHRRSIVVQ
jgi:hypothetical protein